MDWTRYLPLLQDNGSTIVLVVVDGLGGYAEPDRGSALEIAVTPTLDHLASEGIVGFLEPAGPGVPVGTARGHLALLGYDPWTHDPDGGGALPSLAERTGLRAAAVTRDPAPREVVTLVGMAVLGAPTTFAEQVALVREHHGEFDLFVVHHGAADVAGLAGDVQAKIDALTALDAELRHLVALGPDVVAVTGGHATPPTMGARSWHPVPALLWGRHVGTDHATAFGERACAGGMLGLRPATDLMPLLLGAAGRLAPLGG